MSLNVETSGLSNVVNLLQLIRFATLESEFMLRTTLEIHINVKQPNFSSRVIGILNFEKTLFKFYRRHYGLISKCNIGMNKK